MSEEAFGGVQIGGGPSAGELVIVAYDHIFSAADCPKPHVLQKSKTSRAGAKETSVGFEDIQQSTAASTINGVGLVTSTRP